MEPLTVRVRSVTFDADVLTALVTATGRERFKWQPAARIQITPRLPVREGESPREARERVRDETLRYLDIA